MSCKIKGKVPKISIKLYHCEICNEDKSSKYFNENDSYLSGYYPKCFECSGSTRRNFVHLLALNFHYYRAKN